MSTTLEDIKAFLSANSITNPIYLNKYDIDDNCITLLLYGGGPGNILRTETIQIQVKDLCMQTAETKINQVYELLYPKKDIINIITMNGIKYEIKANQSPFYNDQDMQDRETYIFNITVRKFR